MEHTKIAVDPDLYAYDADQYHPDDWQSETTTIESSIYRGFLENGRRYQTFKGESFVPSDDQQFETYEAGHITALVMESHRDNPLFRSPLGDDMRHVLDIGTGTGSWAIDVADMFPHAIVRGVDLFPPPAPWVPPNCILEVDDITQEWTWHLPFDLIHMRLLDAAFTPEENEEVLDQCYRYLRPGGWIELLELTADFQSEDNSWSEDCPLKNFMPMMKSAAAKTGRPLHLYHRCAELVRSAGFLDIHEEVKKWPIGPWARDAQLKEAGSLNLEHWTVGVEGYVMYLLTKYGDPTPWSHDEVQVFLAQIRNELKKTDNHLFHRVKRVWARKPYIDEVVLQSVEN